MCLLQTKTFPVYKNISIFQNEYNKVEIELRVVQFWTEIKLVITNRTPASRSGDFVITRLISVKIALHSVQSPLLIIYIKILLDCDWLISVHLSPNSQWRRQTSEFGERGHLRGKLIFGGGGKI